VTANVVCPGFVRTPLVDKQIPEQAAELGITPDEVIRGIMLKHTVDGESPLRRTLRTRCFTSPAHHPTL
jgi:NAD(P)-dependent dehydrogenase (short-subunit alcohol dehydrogenase family)